MATATATGGIIIFQFSIFYLRPPIVCENSSMKSLLGLGFKNLLKYVSKSDFFIVLVELNLNPFMKFGTLAVFVKTLLPSSVIFSSLNGPSFPRMPSFDGTSKPPLKWRRVLLKVSGEALAGDEEQNIDPKVFVMPIKNLLVSASLFAVSFFRSLIQFPIY